MPSVTRSPGLTSTWMGDLCCTRLWWGVAGPPAAQRISKEPGPTPQAGRQASSDRVTSRRCCVRWGRPWTPSHEARFYEKLPDERVRCTLCPYDCVISDGGRGACGVRYNDRGSLYTLVYDKVVAREVNPIEKKPFFHFHPASYAYSIATVGCNVRCAFC